MACYSYIKLQKKLPVSMLASYHRWIFKNRKSETVEVLREWAIQESRVVSRKAKKKQHTHASSSLRDHYSEYT